MSKRDLRATWVEALESVELDDDDDDLNEYTARGNKAKDPSQVYSLRIPVRHLDALRKLASQRDVTPTSLMRGWVIDRLESEMLADSAREFSRKLGFSGDWVRETTALRTQDGFAGRLQVTQFVGHGRIVDEVRDDMSSERPLIAQ